MLQYALLQLYTASLSVHAVTSATALHEFTYTISQYALLNVICKHAYVPL
jgi:hypothetical protein